MVSETETPVTREQLEAAHAEQENLLATDQQAYEKALRQLDKNKGNVSTEQLIELASAVTKAKENVALREKLVTKAADQVTNFAFIAKRDVTNAAVQRIQDATKAAVEAERAVLIDGGVDKLTFAPVEIGESVPAISIKPAGVGVGKVSIPRAPRANGDGSFQSRGAVTVDGVEYSSLNKAYMTLRAQADGKDVAEITPANSESAARWLAKNGHNVA